MNKTNVILSYLNKITGHSNWYKIHRKYSGDSQYVAVLENLEDTIQYMENQKLISIEKIPGEIDRIDITGLGKQYLELNS
ncbi:hypothetical protein [Dyadobacter diqingensis]|uniref:hypothetical protein n=1 Tax=Dyadobacter diqingensis TaxID=2938121 RepID=UPI0020C26F8C|nr:hypothetical protein [Dyadobacter diqingensis]